MTSNQVLMADHACYLRSFIGFTSKGFSETDSVASPTSILDIKPFSSLEIFATPLVFTSCLSASEMELSENYTCVISHGPNPKTTHIFDNCIVESCCGVVRFSASRKENFFSACSRFPSENFLSFCYACKKNLGQGKDISMIKRRGGVIMSFRILKLTPLKQC
ncbi:FCS-Like Zinc finger 8-like [Macadamia integrifolia]|uniref:FCS-Like Zinc finger 8-like n=1 Tax=Macadamia integrifolia TaxID=60698 RepID=UPI001C4EB7E2|nr:FCS-Like Zinc finger 8-like [Macadamia integrifolia]